MYIEISGVRYEEGSNEADESGSIALFNSLCRYFPDTCNLTIRNNHLYKYYIS